MVQTFYFCLEQLKILSDKFIEYPAFLLIGANEILSDLLYILDGVAGMHLLALAVVLDAALGLADWTCAGAGYAAPHLHRFEGVQPA